MRKEARFGDEVRWVVSSETRCGGRSYGVKMSLIVSETEVGSVMVCFSVSLRVAWYDSLFLLVYLVRDMGMVCVLFALCTEVPAQPHRYSTGDKFSKAAKNNDLGVSQRG